jgi:3-hydroxyacyl-[acyl-carrier-protein] dehydratase
MKIIPHREPFLLIDEVVEMETGESITAIKHVKRMNTIQGTFSEEP